MEKVYILKPSAPVHTEAWSPPLEGLVELPPYAPEPADDEPAGDPDTGVEIPAGYDVVGVFGEPWAMDTVTQKTLPSNFSVRGNTVTQTTDASGAVGTVVSDPFFVPIVYIAIGLAARQLVKAGVRAIVIRGAAIRGAAYATRGGFSTFAKFKKAHGTQKGYEWHHIVEQGNLRVKSWSAKAIHHKNNLIAIPKEIHQKCINSWMNRKNVSKFGIKTGNRSMRSVVRDKDFSTQHAIGLSLLRYCGVQI